MKVVISILLRIHDENISCLSQMSVDVLAMHLGAGFQCWVLVCRTIEKKTKVYIIYQYQSICTNVKIEALLNMAQGSFTCFKIGVCCGMRGVCYVIPISRMRIQRCQGWGKRVFFPRVQNWGPVLDRSFPFPKI